MSAKPTATPAPRSQPSLGKKLVFSFVAVLLVLGGFELVLRAGHFTYKPRQKLLWKPTVAGFQGTYEYYIQTEFAPPGYIWLSQRNTPYTDSNGFRLPEIPLKKPAGKFRIAFLGGSTTQGGYRPYPERAVRILNEALGTDRYEALNVGCSSYSTHQSLIALQRWVFQREPDLICLYHGWNDCGVQEDGFRDDEKDGLFEVGRKVSGAAAVLGKLRLSQLIGKLMDQSRHDWPRARVPLDRFRANLEKFSDLCHEHGVKGVLFTRPPWRKDPLPPMDATQTAFYEKKYGTTDKAAWLARVHEDYSGIQREVASARNMGLFDASAVVRDVFAQQQAGAFGGQVRVYQPDGGHLSPFGEQRLSEQLALYLAGEQVTAVQAYLDSAAYLARLAQVSLEETLPFDAEYYARKAMEKDASLQAEMTGLLTRAEGLFEFSRLFEEAKWGGPDQVFESKIQKLRKCLSIRPDDLGVLIQLFRVCVYMNKIESAAPAMDGFQPRSAQDFYQWKNMEFQSNATAKRWNEAERSAQDILKVNPSDPQASAFLNSLRQARGR